MMFNVPPGLILILGGLLLPLMKGPWRTALLLLAPLATLGAVWHIPLGATVSIPFLEYTLTPLQSTELGRIFATAFSLVAFVGGLYAFRQARTLELSAAYVYAGAAIGVTFAGDLLTLLIFWEVMAVGSTLVIWAAGTNSSYAASMRYFMVHVLGGVILMVGIVGHIMQSGTVAFTAMQPDSIFNGLILIGFLINAAAPPLSAWLSDAYPEATPSGMVFLSAFTTKTAVFALLVGFPGCKLLIPIGTYMIFYGIIYALLENDMRRILAYSIISQVGFMVVAIGIGTDMSLNGAAAHAFTHIIYKALLLMSAGSVLFMTSKRKCSELGGLFQSMPLTMLCGVIGAMAISAFPFTSGFISKSMITQAVADLHMPLVWFLLTAASAGTFLYVGIKFPWFVFFQKDSGMRPPDPPWNMRVPMLFLAFLCIAIGIYPAPLYNILPAPVDYEPYTAEHVVTQFQLLLFAGLAFFSLLPLMKRTLTISLDVDWFYRRLGPQVWRGFQSVIAIICHRIVGVVGSRRDRLFSVLLKTHGPRGLLARTPPSSDMALWACVLLGACLILSLF